MMRREKIVTLRCSPDEYRRFRLLARAERATLSDTIRRALERRAEEVVAMTGRERTQDTAPETAEA